MYEHEDKVEWALDLLLSEGMWRQAVGVFLLLSTCLAPGSSHQWLGLCSLRLWTSTVHRSAQVAVSPCSTS